MRWAVTRVIVTLNALTRSAASNASVRLDSLAVDIDASVGIFTDVVGFSSSSSPSSLYSPKEHSVTNSELDSRAGQHDSKKATLIVAREEKIKYT